MRIKRLIATALLVTLSVTSVMGCGSGKNENSGSKVRPDFTSELVATFEAEDGTFTGNVHAASSLDGFSGSGYVDGFNKADEDFATVTVTVDQDDFYDIYLTVRTGGAFKNNRCYLDGEMIGSLDMETSGFEDIIVPHTYLSAGTHEIMMDTYWGYYQWDKVDLYTSEPIWDGFYDVSAKLVNPNASENAKRLMSYLCDIYGTYTLSGQYCCEQGLYGDEMATIKKVTGKFPAVVGLDMSAYSPTSVANGTNPVSVDNAITAWEDGAIVTMCWHWTGPSGYVKKGANWYSSFYKESSSINLDKAMNGKDDAALEAIKSDIRAIAEDMLPLKEADVPVIWRPLHEAAGGWFWWGDCDAESYIALYRLIYQIFTEEYELNNLIWLWNGQSEEWYPGDDVVDILGWDIYAGEKVYTSQTAYYYRTKNCSGTPKLVCLSENGTIPDPDNLDRDGAKWLFFATWEGEFVTSNASLKVYSERYTSREMIQKVYNHESIITKDELPDLKTYPIREDAE